MRGWLAAAMLGAMIAACGAPPEPQLPAAPVVSGPRSACPYAAEQPYPWTHAALPSCPAPQFDGVPIECETDCPRPCARTSGMASSGRPKYKTGLDYDARRRLVSEREDRQRSHFTYDGERFVRWALDTDPSGTVVDYDARGRIVTAHMYASPDTHLTYDARGRVVTIDGGQSASTLEYDAQGRLSIERTRDDVLHYEYGADGRVARRTSEQGKTAVEDYRRDASGQLVELRSHDGDTTRTTTIRYDRARRPTEARVDIRSAGGPADAEIVKFGYCD